MPFRFMRVQKQRLIRKLRKAMRKVLAEQIIKPVRFVEQIEAMHAAGVRTFVEVAHRGCLPISPSRFLMAKSTRPST